MKLERINWKPNCRNGPVHTTLLLLWNTHDLGWSSRPIKATGTGPNSQTQRLERHHLARALQSWHEWHPVQEILTRSDGKRPDGQTLISWENKVFNLFNFSHRHSGRLLQSLGCSISRRPLRNSCHKEARKVHSTGFPNAGSYIV